MQPSIRVALTKWSHTEPERGFEPGSAGYKAAALPFELSSIDMSSLFVCLFHTSYISTKVESMEKCSTGALALSVNIQNNKKPIKSISSFQLLFSQSKIAQPRQAKVNNWGQIFDKVNKWVGVFSLDEICHLLTFFAHQGIIGNVPSKCSKKLVTLVII